MLQRANGEQYNHEGIIETTEADFNNETGNIAFRATFPNPDGLLRHGEAGTILMPVRCYNALLIPQAATFDVLDKLFVYVVAEKVVLTTRQVSVGVEMPHLYSITSGLTAKEKILAEGL